MTNKDRPSKIRRQLDRGRTGCINDLVIGSIDNQSDKKSTELLCNRIVRRGLCIAYDINGIFIKQINNPTFTMLNGPANGMFGERLPHNRKLGKHFPT